MVKCVDVYSFSLLRKWIEKKTINIEKSEPLNIIKKKNNIDIKKINDIGKTKIPRKIDIGDIKKLSEIHGYNKYSKSIDNIKNKEEINNITNITNNNILDIINKIYYKKSQYYLSNKSKNDLLEGKTYMCSINSIIPKNIFKNYSDLSTLYIKDLIDNKSHMLKDSNINLILNKDKKLKVI